MTHNSFRRCKPHCDAIGRTLTALDEANTSAWCAALAALEKSNNGTEERLRVYQQMRDATVVPDAAAFYLICSAVISIADTKARHLLEDVDQELDKVFQQKGLDDWRMEGPREADAFLEFESCCPSVWDGLFFDSLRQHAEHEMAELFRTNRGEFMSQFEIGSSFFHDINADRQGTDWITSLVREIGKNVVGWKLPNVRVGTQEFETEDGPVVLLFGMPLQVIGGPQDGEAVISMFSVDIDDLKNVFDVVESCQWKVATSSRRAGLDPRIIVTGAFQGHPIELHLCQLPPEEVGPASQVNAADITAK